MESRCEAECLLADLRTYVTKNLGQAQLGFLDYVTRLEVSLDTWAFYPVMHLPFFGERTSNRSESENSAAKGRRGVPGLNAATPAHRVPVGTNKQVDQRNRERLNKLAFQLGTRAVQPSGGLGDGQETLIYQHLCKKGAELLQKQRSQAANYSVTTPKPGVMVVSLKAAALEHRKQAAAQRIHATIVRDRVVSLA